MRSERSARFSLIENHDGFCAGLVEADAEGALRGFAEVVKMEGDKGEW